MLMIGRTVLITAAAFLGSACAPPSPARASTEARYDGDSRAADSPIQCDACAEWSRPREPFPLFGNTYYVGPMGVSSLVITTSSGLVLLDGALPQSAAAISANIRKLGFRPEDIRLILNSHAHFDHAGGIAAMQKLSGARVVASALSARALERGWPTEDDPQYQSGRESKLRYAPIANVEKVGDGQALTVGDVTITAHLTPGHTPGSTTWTWRTCEAERCLDVVYADSLSPIADPGFRFEGDASHPSVVAAFRHSIEAIDRLPCDLLVTVHPESMHLDEKLAARAKGASPDPFIDANACHAYAAGSLQALEKRLAAEQ